MEVWYLYAAWRWTYWRPKHVEHWINNIKTSGIKLVSLYSTIKMMHGPINIRCAKSFFLISLLYASTCFEHCCAHHQEVKIMLYSIWYHHTCRWPSGAQVERRFCATSWLSTRITLRCTVSKTSKFVYRSFLGVVDFYLLRSVLMENGREWYSESGKDGCSYRYKSFIIYQ